MTMLLAGAGISIASLILIAVLRPTAQRPSFLSDSLAVALAVFISCSLATGVGLVFASLWS